MIQLDLHFNYPNRSPMHFVLKAKKGEKISIIGASGSGKSTLLNLMAGFEMGKGILKLNGKDHLTTAPNLRPVSMLFQENNIFPHLTVAENLFLGIRPSLKLPLEEQQKAKAAADAVGLLEYWNHLPNELSGGQRQRIALARCLLREKPILLLDEPFSALDPKLRVEMLQLILHFVEKKSLTLLMVTHQVNEISDFMDRILTVKDGNILEEGTAP